MLIELRSSIDTVMFFSSFELIVLLLDGKVMTCILYPLIKFQEIVEDWNATDSFAFEGVIVWSKLNKLNWKSSKLLLINLCNH